MAEQPDQIAALAAFYDSEAEATGWSAPDMAFGMMSKHIRAGQSVLDLGIGTGLSSARFVQAGLAVSGMDIDRLMLEVCRCKGLADLACHDLTQTPYPYASASFDHAVCLGVLSFLADVSAVFAECRRILKPRGLFAFVTLDRLEGERVELTFVPDTADSGEEVTLYRHSPGQVHCLASEYGFGIMNQAGFAVFRDRARRKGMAATCYLARRLP